MHLGSKIKHTYYAVFSVQVHGSLGRMSLPGETSYKAIPTIHRDRKGKHRIRLLKSRNKIVLMYLNISENHIDSFFVNDLLKINCNSSGYVFSFIS